MRGGPEMTQPFNVTLTCTDCPTRRFFTAEDVTALFKAMELAGWHHLPTGEGEPHSGMARCPECYRKRQQSEKGD